MIKKNGNWGEKRLVWKIERLRIPDINYAGNLRNYTKKAVFSCWGFNEYNFLCQNKTCMLLNCQKDGCLLSQGFDGTPSDNVY